MTNAQDFLSSLPSQDSTVVYEAVSAASKEGSVSEDQDWTNEMSIWTFEDGSAIVIQNADVTVIHSIDDLRNEVAEAVEKDESERRAIGL